MSSSMQKFKKPRKVENMSINQIKIHLKRMGISFDESDRPKEYYINLYKTVKDSQCKVMNDTALVDLEKSKTLATNEHYRENEYTFIGNSEKLTFQTILIANREESVSKGKIVKENGNEKIITCPDEKKTEQNKISDKNNINESQLLNKNKKSDILPQEVNQPGKKNLTDIGYNTKKRTKSKEGRLINEELPEEKYIIIEKKIQNYYRYKVESENLNKDKDKGKVNTMPFQQNKNTKRTNRIIYLRLIPINEKKEDNRQVDANKKEKVNSEILSNNKREDNDKVKDKDTNKGIEKQKLDGLNGDKSEINNINKGNLFLEVKIKNDEKEQQPEVINKNKENSFLEEKNKNNDNEQQPENVNKTILVKEKDKEFNDKNNLNNINKDKDINTENETEAHTSDEIRMARLKAFDLLLNKNQGTNNISNNSNDPNKPNKPNEQINFPFSNILNSKEEETQDNMKLFNKPSELSINDSISKKSPIQSGEYSSSTGIQAQEKMIIEDENEEKDNEISNDENLEDNSLKIEGTNQIQLNSTANEETSNYNNNQNVDMINYHHGTYKPNYDDVNDNNYNEINQQQNFEHEHEDDNINEENIDSNNNNMLNEKQFSDEEMNYNDNLKENNPDDNIDNMNIKQHQNQLKEMEKIVKESIKKVKIPSAKKEEEEKYIPRIFNIYNRGIPVIPFIISLILLILILGILLASPLYPNSFFHYPIPSENDTSNLRNVLVFLLSVLLILSVAYTVKNTKNYIAIAEKGYHKLKKKIYKKRKTKKLILKVKFIQSLIDRSKMNLYEYVENVLPILEELIIKDNDIIEEIVNNNVYWKVNSLNY